jgi:multidrug efflux pump subunit AcrB
MLTRASLKNPYALFAICMIVLVLGGVSYQKMRVDIFPEIKIPTILVTTFYRGLSPSEMEGAITLKMEQRFVEASLPIGLLSVSCESLGPKEIRDLAYFTVRQQIATIPGISFGPPLGGQVRQITVFFDQQRMLARAHDRTGVVGPLENVFQLA